MMGSRGFTLIEIMIAIAILAVITALVYASFATSTRSIDRARRSAEEMRLRQFMAQSFHANFTAAAVYEGAGDSDPIFLFEAIDDGDGESAKDSVAFCSSAPLAGGMGFPGDLKRVRYAIVSSEEALGAEREEWIAERSVVDRLEVTEAPLLAGGVDVSDADAVQDRLEEASRDEDAAVTTSSWTVPVRSMNLDYFDGQTWCDDWNSQERGRLPWCVRIRINFAKTEAQLAEEREDGIDPSESPDFEMVVPIPRARGLMSDRVEGAALDDSGEDGE